MVSRPYKYLTGPEPFDLTRVRVLILRNVIGYKQHVRLRLTCVLRHRLPELAVNLRKNVHPGT